MIQDYLHEEFKDINPLTLIQKLKDMNSAIFDLKVICEEYEENDYSELSSKIKNIAAEHKQITLFFDEFPMPGTNLSEKLGFLSHLIKNSSNLYNSELTSRSSSKDNPFFSDESGSNIADSLQKILKNVSSNILSLITKISHAVQQNNEKLRNLMQRCMKSPKFINKEYNHKELGNQLRDYEISTVKECSEKDDDSFTDDLELKVELSAKRIKELNDEIHYLKLNFDKKEEKVHSLEKKIEGLKLEKDKKTKENASLQQKISELENEIKTSKEQFEISDKKKSNQIFALESRISGLKKEYDSLKSSIVSEKDELFDHIIRIEQESKNQIVW